VCRVSLSSDLSWHSQPAFYHATLERIQGVIAQAVYMDPGVKQAHEQARVLGNKLVGCER